MIKKKDFSERHMHDPQKMLKKAFHTVCKTFLAWLFVFTYEFQTGLCKLHLKSNPHFTQPESSAGVLGEFRQLGIDSPLLPAVKSLYSCSEVCVRVGGVKSLPSSVSVGL